MERKAARPLQPEHGWVTTTRWFCPCRAQEPGGPGSEQEQTLETGELHVRAWSSWAFSLAAQGPLAARRWCWWGCREQGHRDQDGLPHWQGDLKWQGQGGGIWKGP